MCVCGFCRFLWQPHQAFLCSLTCLEPLRTYLESAVMTILSWARFLVCHPHQHVSDGGCFSSHSPSCCMAQAASLYTLSLMVLSCDWGNVYCYSRLLETLFVCLNGDTVKDVASMTEIIVCSDSLCLAIWLEQLSY